jgi:hypothetical protein
LNGIFKELMGFKDIFGFLMSSSTQGFKWSW